MVKVEIQPHTGSCGPLTDAFGPPVPLLVVTGPETTKLTSLSGNQAFTFTSLTLGHKNGKTVQKFNAQHAEMRLLAYRSVPLSVPCIFWKFEVRERLGLKIVGMRTAFPASYGTLTTAQANTSGLRLKSKFLHEPASAQNYTLALDAWQQDLYATARHGTARHALTQATRKRSAVRSYVHSYVRKDYVTGSDSSHKRNTSEKQPTTSYAKTICNNLGANYKKKS